MLNPLVSIITSTYNCESTLKDTVNSILNQTYTNLEYIIIDGNSSDSTVDLIKSFEKDFKIKEIKYSWVSESDRGIYDAWNKGIKMATGDWIVFIGGHAQHVPPRHAPANAATQFSHRR